MLKDFKAFIMRGNVVDMAVGIIIGAAFGAIITSLVRDVIMPPIGLALGKVDFTNLFAVLQAGESARALCHFGRCSGCQRRNNQLRPFYQYDNYFLDYRTRCLLLNCSSHCSYERQESRTRRTPYH